MKELIIVGKDVTHIDYDSMKELERKYNRYLYLKERKAEWGAISLGGILSQFGLGQNIVKGGSQKGKFVGYPSTLTVEQGDAGFNTEADVAALATVIAGVTARIYEHSIPPRYSKVWGSGAYGVQSNQGYWWFFIIDDGVDFQTDIVTLAVESYDRHTFIPVEEKSDNILHAIDNTDPGTATPVSIFEGMSALPQTAVIAAPYSRLVINVRVLVASAGPAECRFSIPVTVASQ